MRNDLKTKIEKQYKTKTEKIKEEYGLTKEQAKKISMLEEWAVEAAIKQGWENREIPTRTLAIQMIKARHKAENNKPYYVFSNHCRVCFQPLSSQLLRSPLDVAF